MKRVALILSLLALTGQSFGQLLTRQEQRQIAAQLAKYKNADVATDLQRAWSKGDLRFIGIYGISLSTPGVPDADQGFVHLVGVRPIEGTSDAISSSAQMELNDVGSRYATKYNSILFQKIKASRTTNPTLIQLFNGLEQEIKNFEQADPRKDFVTNMRNRDFRFIYLYDIGLELVGVPDEEFEKVAAQGFEYRYLKGNKQLLTKEQYGRLQQVAKTYVRPYNKMLFAYLTRKSKSTK